MPLSKATQKFLGLDELSSNQEIIKSLISKFPGLRFHEIKKETGLANGTLQHHLGELTKSDTINAEYDQSTPRYFSHEIATDDKNIIKRLSQPTTSKIIKALLKNECQSFAQLVKFTKKSPGTVSIYKNKLLEDGIIVGDTNACKRTKNISLSRIRYRLTKPEKIMTIVEEYGKSSLQNSADNLADIFLSLK